MLRTTAVIVSESYCTLSGQYILIITCILLWNECQNIVYIVIHNACKQSSNWAEEMHRFSKYEFVILKDCNELKSKAFKKQCLKRAMKLEIKTFKKKI